MSASNFCDYDKKSALRTFGDKFLSSLIYETFMTCFIWNSDQNSIPEINLCGGRQFFFLVGGGISHNRFPDYLYKIVSFIIKIYNIESSVKIIRKWIKLSLFLSGFLYQLSFRTSVSPQRHVTMNGLSFLVPSHPCRCPCPAVRSTTFWYHLAV